MLGCVAIDRAQEAQELPVAVSRHAFADDLAGGHVEGGKQCRGAVALVVMSHRAGPPLLDGQPRLRAVERLDLALLIDAKHQGLLGGLR